MAHVYRFELPENGNGPYNPGRDIEQRETIYALVSDLLYAHGTDSEHPDMFRDTGISRWDEDASEYYACFHAPDQLMKWFEGFLFRLEEAGFRIAIYETPEYVTGTYQHMFKRAKAEFVRYISLTELLSS